MSQFITLTADDEHSFAAYHVAPMQQTNKALVVIQEVFGVNSHIRSVCDRYAHHGYEVIAPALFDRQEKNVELDYIEQDLNKGIQLATDIGHDKALKDIAACIRSSPCPYPDGLRQASSTPARRGRRGSRDGPDA